MFLTDEELEELTTYRTRPKQIAWLKTNGYPFEIGGNGRARVLKAMVLAKLGAPVQPPETRPQVRIPSSARKV